MADAATEGHLPFRLAALLATQVGTWERSPETGTFRGDRALAALFGFDPTELDSGMRLERVSEIIHPDDAPMFRRKLQLIQDRGGLILSKYRVRTNLGGIRWILVRGHYDRIRSGDLIAGGRGIAIDITEADTEGRAEERPFCVTDIDDEGGLQPIHRAADYVMLAFRELQAAGESGQHIIAAAELLMLLIGKELARTLR